jgi:dihydroorotate dehydrogenase (fumarate)
MDLSTQYLGFRLEHPFMPGASPLVDDIDTVRRLEEAGAPAIVMHSLFEEQIRKEELATFVHTESHGQSFAEALSFFPPPDRYALGPHEYLEHLGRVKRAVGVPVIASLNGTTPGGWIEYAKLMQQAGADALELNVYSLETDAELPGSSVEERSLEVIRAVRAAIDIPLAVKLSPFYTCLAHFCGRVDAAGANALVLFNRFYQPDIDLEALDVSRRLELSHPSELPLRLRWLAVLSGRLQASLAVTGGVHSATDGLKAVMAGASAVQVVSALLRRGPSELRRMREGMAHWLEEHEYDSLSQALGSMSLASCPDPAVYERANYMIILQSWRAEALPTPGGESA